MELPTEVLIHNQILGLKGTRGTLLRVSEEGYYELNCRFGERLHRTLLPVAATVLISQQPEEAAGPGVEIER